MSDPASKADGVIFRMLILAFVLLIAWSMLPLLAGGGPVKPIKIINNLGQIGLMKETWAWDHGVTGSVKVSESDLAPYARGYSSNGLVRPVVGERYFIHRLGVGPEAQLTRDYGKFPAGTVIRLRADTNLSFQILQPNEQGGAKGGRPFDSKAKR